MSFLIVQNIAGHKVIATPERAFVSLSPSMQSVADMIIQEDSILKSYSSPLFVENVSLASISSEAEKEKDIIYYTVKEGDTLWDIANKYGISVETILLANEISKSASLKVGQKLIILPTEGLMYMVEKGDTLSSIATTYKADIDEIVSYNELKDENDIYPGDILLIPNGEMPAQEVYISSSSNSSATQVLDDYFICPTTGIITNGLHYYNAIDVANSKGTPILAAASGTVQKARYAWPSGNYVTILHPNGVITYYGHLSYWTVVPGQYVSQGEVIGYMGNTGLVISLGGDGSHLHFDVRGAKNPLRNYTIGTKVSY